MNDPSLRLSDAYWMRQALAAAVRGQGWVEPNPMVGAVVVNSGVEVARGFHRQFGGPHAEIEALTLAGERSRGATLYVTLEPCSHHGKTPPCAEAIIRAGIRRVVAAMRDPFDKVAGRGFERLRAAGVEVALGVEEEAACSINAPYLTRLLLGRPYTIAKWAMTLDGRTACVTGDSRWISNERSRALVHQLRGQVDAIVAGIGTVLADDPRLTARPAGPRLATRLILDRAGRLPLSSQLVQSARETPLVVAVAAGAAPSERRRALEKAGCEVIAFEGEGPVPLATLFEQLAERSWTNVLVEGGGHVTGAFLDAGRIDEALVFVGPLIEGGSHGFSPVRGLGVTLMNAATRLRDVSILQLDGDVAIRGRLDSPLNRPPNR